VLPVSPVVEGWTTPAQLAFLQALALTVPEGGTAVELGSWRGRSTIAIRDALPQSASLYAVDTFSGDPVSSAAFSQAELDKFLENTRGHGAIEPVVGQSAVAAAGFADGSVDMVFVDADHAYPAVRADLIAWAPKLKPSGLMCGHDWGWVGVRVAVRERYGSVPVFESIWYTRRAPAFHPLGHLEKRARLLTGRLTADGRQGRRSRKG
jgi:predicted O-methyltransferase YrrM